MLPPMDLLCVLQQVTGYSSYKIVVPPYSESMVILCTQDIVMAELLTEQVYHSALLNTSYHSQQCLFAVTNSPLRHFSMTPQVH